MKALKFIAIGFVCLACLMFVSALIQKYQKNLEEKAELHNQIEYLEMLVYQDSIRIAEREKHEALVEQTNCRTIKIDY